MVVVLFLRESDCQIDDRCADDDDLEVNLLRAMVKERCVRNGMVLR